MTQKDLSTVTAVGILAAALVLALAGVGVAVPSSVVALAPIVAAVAILIVRGYVAIKGADNTPADEILDQVEDGVAKLRDVVRPANAKPVGKPPIADDELPPDACRGQHGAVVVRVPGDGTVVTVDGNSADGKRYGVVAEHTLPINDCDAFFDLDGMLP